MMIWSKPLVRIPPCYSTVKKWVADFKQGRESTDDDARTGRPKSDTTDAQVEGIHRMVMNDRRVTVKHIAGTLVGSYSFSTVKKWVADFKQGRESTDDDARTGRPKSATTDAQVEGIHRMVMTARRVTVKHIAGTLVGSYSFDRNLGDEQVVCQTDTPNADTRPKAEQA